MTNYLDKSCLYSTVQNTSGGTKKFGFLPPHGQSLEAGEEFTVFGHIIEAVTRFERATDRRHHQALAAAIERGDITIVTTPAPIMQDQTTLAVKMLRLNNGSLGVADPCWNASNSASDDAVPA